MQIIALLSSVILFQFVGRLHALIFGPVLLVLSFGVVRVVLTEKNGVYN